ncbi:MAG: GxxExxY protein [Bacteroidales bacterium]|nr:GxxExxY protein [Candidatus Liminaster caballi]
MQVADSIINDLINKIYFLSKDVLEYYHYGLQESAYQAALIWELNHARIKTDFEQLFHQWYKNNRLEKAFRIDLVVADSIIVELKTKEELTSEHRLQLFNYLRLVNMSWGVLLNFSPHGVEIERYHYDAAHNQMILFDRFGNSVFS